MRLDETTIRELVHLLGAAADQDPLGRRRETRYRTKAQITVRPYGVVHPAPRTVDLLDISPSGLAIVDRMAMSPGLRFTATLPSAKSGQLTVLCEARQSRLNSSGQFRISAAFADSDHTQRFVRGADGVIDEGSITPHRPNEPAILRSAAGVADATIRDFKDGVFTLLIPQPLRVGEQFVLEVRQAGRAQAWRCSTVDIEEAANDRYAVIARVQAPAEPGFVPRGSHGWLNWFRRR